MAGNDIKYDIIADATRFGNGVRAAEKDAMRLQGTVNRINSQSASATGVFSSNANRTGQAITQLAYGVEDAVSQFGTMGLAGALRGASNNLSGVAAAMGGPWAVAATVLGTTVAALGIQYFTSGKNAKSAKQQIDDYTESVKKQIDQIKANVEFQQKLDKIRTGEDAAKQRSDLQDDIAAREAAIKDLRRQQNNLQGLIDNAIANNNKLDQEMPFGQFFFGADINKEREKLKEIGKLIQDEQEQVGKARAKLNDFRNAAPEIQAREEQDKASKKMKEDIEDQRRLSEELAKESMTAQDRYFERLKQIDALKTSGQITAEQAAKYERYAADQLEKQVELRRESNRLLTGALDIRSAEAFGVLANAQARSSIRVARFVAPSLPSAPQPVPEVASNEQQVMDWLRRFNEERTAHLAPANDKSLKAEEATASGVKRIGDILERRPSIPVVGLN